LADPDAEGRDAKSAYLLQRIAVILDCFTPETPQLRAIDICRTTDLPKSTVGRLLHNLAEENILERTGDYYSIGLRVANWWSAASSNSDLTAIARPSLEWLRDQTNETCDVFARKGMTRILVAQARSTRSLLYSAQEGTVVPLVSGASGKIFMAFDEGVREQALKHGLPQFTKQSITDAKRLDAELHLVRSRGWSFVEGEYEDDLNAVAAPIFRGGDKELIGTAAIGAPATRLPPERAEKFGELTAHCARQISQRLLH
jgi:DNA-binding IclR family transcriptional regulator